MFFDKKDIFFDLDHTIWDFDKNARETLQELYHTYKFDALTGESSPDAFIDAYTANNHRLWGLYHHGLIDKAMLRKARFEDTFSQLGISPSLFPWAFEEEYLAICPTKTNLFPHAHETLAYLANNYRLHVISNGFKEACETKLAHSKLVNYFQTIVISENVGVNKPNPAIFHYALKNGEAAVGKSVMIGDNLDADVRGAQAVGMDAIFFNAVGARRPADVKYMIADLRELQSYF
ncbi:YjjG family noncanonical pyrimidine nucleotidase [Sphingobacterium griseoflavum]|uniref:Noncanonical pyrimidine nucleotidase, YjjG family protein n=1 Tax=Sphingobacterium griseoflavum TaxID=1474952 RepID=A0ABQ3HR12_9SPHI|nr:YjjG family noncanonical pyrimidine nucleotidase [Sphingobacterium griseoflavum]GHE23559.1 noncanonical pyrimidine nucleotidase, YjjG family protein [Sphingobacterium griseoflavum]